MLHLLFRIRLMMGEEVAKTERGKWNNSAEFLLSCLGYAVGLGNVWRFPYICVQNGGGAFLIPYVLMLIFVGIPIFFIELSLGQYTSSGPLHAFECVPLLQGVGAGMLVISFIGVIYYNMVIAWSLYYLFASWQSVLPWAGCNNDFNTAYCYSKREATECESGNDTWFNQTCHSSSLDWLTNVTSQRTSSSDEYFKYSVMDRSDSIADTGPIKWELCLCLLLAWILCYICVVKGIRSSGKVVYFTATFPYLIIAVLLVRGAMLEGSLEGIKYYIIPDWQKLKTPEVWVDAAGQIFFSLSVGMGGLLTFASYNPFNHNVYRDTLIVSIGNCLTSFIAGFAIFSILGFQAKQLGQDVSNVAKSGAGLAFVVYPEVVTWLNPPQLWSSLFFFMLLMLGLDSQFANIENLQTALIDSIPRLRAYKPLVALVLCVIPFLIGLPMTARSGIYWVELMTYYSGGWSLVLIAMSEVMVIAWAYGATKMIDNIEEMLGFRLYRHWWVCWTIISPLLLLGIFVFNMIEVAPLRVGEDYKLEGWAQILGWLMAVSSVAMIPIFAVYKICASYNQPEYMHLGFGQRMLTLMKPSKRFRPEHVRERDNSNLNEIDTFNDGLPGSSTSITTTDISASHCNSAFEKNSPDEMTHF